MASTPMVSTRSVWWVGLMSVLALASPARADYRYQYIGHPFMVTNSNPPGSTAFDTESSVTADLYTHAPLVAGSNLSDVFRLTLTRNDLSAQTVLEYPYAGEFDPSADPGTFYNPITDATVSIGAIDLHGLPAVWTVAINFYAQYPTGRLYALNFATSNSTDSVSGGYEAFTSFSGSLAGDPGQWSVSAVPEPAEAVLFVAGLALVGSMARKRSVAI